MADDDWTLVREIFEKAARLAPRERPAFLKKACGENASILEEVSSLLESHDSAESFLETPASELLMPENLARPLSLQKGQRIGHYEIGDTVGSGGMGEVYLATDLNLGRRVALKILNSKFGTDELQLRRFVREAKAASGLNHPNILVIHEFGESAGAHFIVSEFVDGRTLRDVMREGRLPLSKVIQISTQIADALSVAHSADLVHRDIKPENIMIRADGYVKVLDFGLAKLVERAESIPDGSAAASAVLPIDLSDLARPDGDETSAGMILGTLNYLSPEQATGQRVDLRTDIFSLGVLIYEMVSGQTPFAGQTVAETINNLLRIEPPPLSHLVSGIPDELRRLVSRCLEKDRDRRYQTMRDVLTDLTSIASSPLSRQGTSNEEAYWLYLQGKNLTATHFPNDALAAVEYFEKATTLDPQFARAYAGLAQALFIASHGGGGSQKELNEQAKAAVGRALEIDGGLGEAHAVMGEIAFTHDWDLTKAEHYLRRSVELEPTSELGHAVFGEYLATRGRFDEAVSEIKTALAIDPKSCANQIIYGRILYFARRYDEAIVQFKRVIEVFPSWSTAYGWIWLTYEVKGDIENAFEWLIRNQEQNNVLPERIAAYTNAYRENGWQGIGEKLMEFERPDGPGGNFYALARHAIRIGKLDLALDYLELSYAAHQYQITWLAVDPYFDPVRDAAPFQAVIDRVGLTFRRE